MRFRTWLLGCVALLLTIHVGRKQYKILKVRFQYSSSVSRNELPSVFSVFSSKSAKEKTLELSKARDSFLNGNWKQPGKKYVFYQPSGGVSNQRILLENAMLVAKKLNRTLLLPPVGPHTAQWFKYNKVKTEDVVDMLDIFDRRFLERVVPVLNLRGVSVEEFFVENLEHSESDWEVFAPVLGKKYPYTVARIVSRLGDCDRDVIFFSKGSLWKLFRMPPSEIRSIRPHVRLRLEFREVARKVANRIIGPVYNSLHIRFPDVDGTNKRLGWLSPNEDFVRRMIVDGYFTKTDLVYVATKQVARNHVFFSIFREKGFRLVFSDEILDAPEVRQFLSRYPVVMSETILGLIEQLICSRAELFLGTGYSTFSMYIRFHREQRLQILDSSLISGSFADIELNDNITEVAKEFQTAIASTASYQNPELRKELSVLTKMTPCDKPMQVC